MLVISTPRMTGNWWSRWQLANRGLNGKRPLNVVCVCVHRTSQLSIVVHCTHKWFSLFISNLSFMSRCRWMAMLGMRRIGRSTWIKRCSTLSPDYTATLHHTSQSVNQPINQSADGDFYRGL